MANDIAGVIFKYLVAETVTVSHVTYVSQVKQFDTKVFQSKKLALQYALLKIYEDDHIKDILKKEIKDIKDSYIFMNGEVGTRTGERARIDMPTNTIIDRMLEGIKDASIKETNHMIMYLDNNLIINGGSKGSKEEIDKIEKSFNSLRDLSFNSFKLHFNGLITIQTETGAVSTSFDNFIKS